MNIAHRITKVLGSAACVLFVGGMLWSGLNGLPSLSPSPKAQDLAKPKACSCQKGCASPCPAWPMAMTASCAAQRLDQRPCQRHRKPKLSCLRRPGMPIGSGPLMALFNPE